jgi:hypothetical protein
MSDRRVTPGTVAAIGEPACDELLPVVVLAEGEDALTVVPVSERVDLATEWDLVLPVQALGYQAIVEVWNYGSVLPEQLDEVLAELEPETFSGLRSLARAAASGGEPLAGVAVGPPVLDDADPRLLFQDAEAERCKVFWGPALTLAGALTIGQLVAHRREELALATNELETVATGSGWLSRLERDELDLRRSLPPASLAALMRRLHIGASRRLGQIAAFTLETQHGGRGGAALARKSDIGTSADDDALPVDQYVDAFLQDLGGR